ncbi:MAG TPA: PDR/VanB family oxidoreductase [Herbaspirillum sp.]|uniref:PDR/VanB family oxidoreductase n=1 Tax=Herbaspirillum sp. TaxID=1890675 RepID=UPI002D63DBB2|nr:PDR/VanB family oxidoreductase [Herbaspirillum sp.]HZG21684.1 PDR/VanB family oxidoreductase [Herbaspirillum sp.]
MNVVIDSIIPGAADIRIFILKPADGGALPPYKAGAHIDLLLGNGLLRQYSLCCRKPSPDSYRIAVKREDSSRGGSAWLHAHAQPGMRLQISAPRNAFALGDASDPHLLLAGGIGITPLLAMAYALLDQGRPFVLACFARDAMLLPMREELCAGPLAAHTRVFLGRDPAGTRAGITGIMAGHPRAQVYTCGPHRFMETVAELTTQRYGAGCLHQESFQAVPAATAEDRPFLIRLRDGREIPVAADQTALASLQQAGVDLPCSCEVGVCGTCRVGLCEGVPLHRDNVLSAEEKASGKWFMPCVSRGTSAVLVLDL